MKTIMSRLRTAPVCVMALLATIGVPTVTVASQDCAPAGEDAFVCGLVNPEDLVHVPDSKWIISSGMSVNGALYLVDTVQKSWRVAFPTEASGERHDTRKFGGCPGAPDSGNFISHGLNLRAGDNKRSTLYVVGHGAREAIEVFDVDATGETPVLTWVGCVLTPDGMAANSVASTKDGMLLATIPLAGGADISDAFAGKPTGGVYRWHPGDRAFTPVEGTEMPYANGIEVSEDGDTFYVASSGMMNVTAWSNTDPARPIGRTGPFPIVPDNLRWDSAGRLLTAGLNLDDPVCGNVEQSETFDLEAFASCPRAYTVLAIDPQTLEHGVVAAGAANENFSNVTMAIPVNGELWIGTFAGDRIAYRPLQEND